MNNIFLKLKVNFFISKIKKKNMNIILYIYKKLNIKQK